ncbi:putative mitochondrial protein [Andalucia godoyi]|uniref:Putative mitochondrial protein n=1 Tax=Andalucia godoyi TaxID=505711 RepID=A0A8K0F2M1_ANDGO|nr:putative mitochondrial protein [Andalucia godoyi]|eukprot:ANDGO_01666.mRNA.1 putative mitochondrial protein
MTGMLPVQRHASVGHPLGGPRHRERQLTGATNRRTAPLTMTLEGLQETRRSQMTLSASVSNQALALRSTIPLKDHVAEHENLLEKRNEYLRTTADALHPPLADFRLRSASQRFAPPPKSTTRTAISGPSAVLHTTSKDRPSTHFQSTQELDPRCRDPEYIEQMLNRTTPVGEIATRFGRTVYPDTKHLTIPSFSDMLCTPDRQFIRDNMSSFSLTDKHFAHERSQVRVNRIRSNETRVDNAARDDVLRRMEREERHIRGLGKHKMRYLEAVTEIDRIRSGIRTAPSVAGHDLYEEADVCDF